MNDKSHHNLISWTTIILEEKGLLHKLLNNYSLNRDENKMSLTKKIRMSQMIEHDKK